METKSTNAKLVGREQLFKRLAGQRGVKTNGERNVMFDLGYGVKVAATVSPQNPDPYDAVDAGFVLSQDSIANFFKYRHHRSAALAYKNQKPVAWIERDDLLEGYWFKYLCKGQIKLEYLSYATTTVEVYQKTKAIIQDATIY